MVDHNESYFDKMITHHQTTIANAWPSFLPTPDSQAQEAWLEMYDRLNLTDTMSALTLQTMKEVFFFLYFSEPPIDLEFLENSLAMFLEDLLGSEDGNGTWTDQDFQLGQVGKFKSNSMWYRVFIYVILVTGVIGNVLLFAILQDSSIRGLSYSVYLRLLTLVDSLVLATVCTEDILQFENLTNNVLDMSNVFCKIWTYLATSVRMISPWLVVVLTFDRFMAVVLPYKWPGIRSLQSAIKISGTLIMIFAVESIVWLVFAKVITENGNIQTCSIEENSALSEFHYVENLLFKSSLPCFLILLMNINIVIAIKRSQNFRKKCATAPNSVLPGHSKSRVNSSTDRVTLSLIAVSVMVFVTLTPKAVIEVLESLRVLENLRESPVYWDIWPIVNIVELFNFAQNFYIMLLTGPKYRSIFLSYFRRK